MTAPTVCRRSEETLKDGEKGNERNTQTAELKQEKDKKLRENWF